MHSFYQQQIMDHYHYPRHKGTLVGGVRSAQANPACGDQIAITLIIDNGIVRNAKFEGVGCILSLAAADMLLDSIIGQQINEVLSLTAQDLQRMVGISVGLTRIKCLLLPFDTIMQALTDHV